MVFLYFLNLMVLFFELFLVIDESDYVVFRHLFSLEMEHIRYEYHLMYYFFECLFAIPLATNAQSLRTPSKPLAET